MIAQRPDVRDELRGAHGLFGGTFDPIHLAHLAVAEAALDDLGLADVTFIPAGQPPHKSDRSISPAADRAAMVAVPYGRGWPGVRATLGGHRLQRRPYALHQRPVLPEGIDR